MASRILVTFEGGKFKQRTSSAETIDFLSVKVGSSEIKETGGQLDFSGHRLTNIVDGVSGFDAVSKSQMDTELALKLNTAVSGANNGLATLDMGGKVPVSQLPNSVLEYQGTWNAGTNTPALANTDTGKGGFFYIASVSGTVNFGAGAFTFQAGDWVINNGTIWEQSHNGNNVDSINGQTGIVVLGKADVGLGNVDNVQQLPMSYLDTSTSLGTSDTKVPSQNAVKVYADTKVPQTTTVNGHQLNANVNVTKGDVGLTNVTDDAQLKAADLDTDGTMAANSSTKIPSQSAVVTYVAAQVGSSVTKSFTNVEGAPITIRKFVFESSEGNVQLAQANDALTPDTFIGCVKDATIADSTPGNIYMPGKGTVIAGFSGLAVGSPIYLSRSSAGGYQQDLTGFVAGEQVVSLGTVVSASEIVFNPRHVLEF